MAFAAAAVALLVMAGAVTLLDDDAVPASGRQTVGRPSAASPAPGVATPTLAPAPARTRSGHAPDVSGRPSQREHEEAIPPPRLSRSADRPAARPSTSPDGDPAASTRDRGAQVPASPPALPNASAGRVGEQAPAPTPSKAVRRHPQPDTRPHTTLDSAPDKRDDSEKAVFAFHADVPSSYTCRLDGSGFRPCRTGVEYDVDAGWHEFAVRAVDSDGEADPTPATWRWHTSANDD